MFWTLALVLLLGSYATSSGFVPVAIFLALTALLTRLARERRRHAAAVTGPARKPSEAELSQQPRLQLPLGLRLELPDAIAAETEALPISSSVCSAPAAGRSGS